MRGLAEIKRVAEGLHALSAAPRASWRAISQRVEEVPFTALAIDAPSAFMLAKAGVAIARQLPHAHETNETELRGVAQSLSVILINELIAAGIPFEAPWWNREAG